MHAAIKTTFATLALACLSLGAQAHSQWDDTPRVDARQDRQQARIADGMADGSLTWREARQLRQQQRHIRGAEYQAKADGVVTAQERWHLAQLQRQASRSIQQQRNDGQQRWSRVD